MFWQDWRRENVKSVISLNYAILEFITKFSGELLSVQKWPRIHQPTRNETIHPLLIEPFCELFVENSNCFPIRKYAIIYTPMIRLNCCVAINSKGEFLYLNKYRNISIINRASGDASSWKISFQLRLQSIAKRIGANPKITVLAIDRYDNVYIIIHYDACINFQGGYVLFVFDSDGNKKHDRTLDFLGEERQLAECVVNNDGEVLIHAKSRNLLYICDDTGTLKYCLPTLKSIRLQCVTSEDEIVMIKGTKDVLVYTKKGKFIRKITVKDDVHRVAYNYQTSKLDIAVTNASSITFILSYLGNDEVERLYAPIEKRGSIIAGHFSYHPAGPGFFMLLPYVAKGLIETAIIFV